MRDVGLTAPLQRWRSFADWWRARLQAGHLETCELLLAARASPHVVTREGKSALTVAREANHASIVALMQAAQ